MTASQPSTFQPGTPTTRTRKKPFGIIIALAIALFILTSFLYTTFKVGVAFDSAIILSSQGKCLITVSRVQQFTNPWVKPGSNVNIPRQQLQYKAQVTYTLLTTDGQRLQGSNYDWMYDVLVNEGSDRARAIVNQYQVGHTYPCWYNPLIPSMSALRQYVDWSLDTFNHATFMFDVGGFVWVIVLLIGLPVATVMIFTRSLSRSRRKATP
jgi:hypothetical protein